MVQRIFGHWPDLKMEEQLGSGSTAHSMNFLIRKYADQQLRC